MAVNTNRSYDNVTHTGASTASKFLRGAVGQDNADNTNLPIEVFVAAEYTGVGRVER